MTFNPMFVAWVASNNANLARLNAMNAQRAADEASQRLADLEVRMEVERQEHTWSLTLVSNGWNRNEAVREAQKETTRRETYPRLEADLARMKSIQPKKGSRAEYRREIDQLRSAIESRRTSRKFGPHPLVLAGTVVVTSIGCALLLASRLGLTSTARTSVAVACGLVALIAALFIRKGTRVFWERFRARAVAKADARADRELHQLPSFATWQYERFNRASKPYWAATGFAFHDRDTLRSLGPSAIDRSRYDSLLSRADNLLQGHWDEEVELLFKAIHDCIDGGQLNRAERLLSELSEAGRTAFRELIQELGAEEGVPLRYSSRDGSPTGFGSDSSDPTATESATRPSSFPSRAQGLKAHFEGNMLCVRWNPPAVQPEAVSTYLVHVGRVGTTDEWTFEVTETECRLELPTLLSQHDYTVCVQVTSNGARGARGKSVNARTAGKVERVGDTRRETPQLRQEHEGARQQIQMDFLGKCAVLGDLWLHHRDDAKRNEAWEQFFIYNDVSLPMSYGISQGYLRLVEGSGLEDFVEETWTMFCDYIDIDPQGIYEGLASAWSASPNPTLDDGDEVV